MDDHHCSSLDCQLCNRLYWPNGNGAGCIFMFLAIKPQAENLKKYLEKINRYIEHHSDEEKPIKLAIVGKDPYPTNPIGIPFAKQTLCDTFNSASGKVLFPSLGISTANWENSNKSIWDFYEALLNKGIVFLNVCYRFLNHKLQKELHKPFLKCADVVNKPILEATKRIIFCGDAVNGFGWVNGQVPHDWTDLSRQQGASINEFYVYHPSKYKTNINIENEYKRKYWDPYWKNSGNLLNVLEPGSEQPNSIRCAIREINELVQETAP